jgi:RNA polymerase sigma-70 factor (ECF subfamily)
MVTTEKIGRTTEEDFTAAVTAHQRALLAHCYRMTGSIHDAEDALQDTLLRAWRSFDSFEGRSSLAIWLFTIATNCCRRQLERRPRRVLPVDFGPPADPHGPVGAGLEESVWVTPFPGTGAPLSPSAAYESKESVELAFIAALQMLPARQRAALLLRDVLAFSAQETADALETSVASVNSSLQRARSTLAERLPRQSQHDHLQAMGPADADQLVKRFTSAWERHDVDDIVSLLAEDIVFEMPPTATWFRGRAAVEHFLRATPLSGFGRWVTQPVAANGQLAFALYLDTGDRAVAHSINVLATDGHRVTDFIAFRSPGLFEAFCLPHFCE